MMILDDVIIIYINKKERNMRLRTNIYSAMSQFVQLVNDLTDKDYGYGYFPFNDIHIKVLPRDAMFGFGAVCFYERGPDLYAMYVTLENNTSTNIPDTVMVTEYKVNENLRVHESRYSKKIAMAHVYELDELFTKLVTLEHELVRIDMVNETDDSVTFKHINKVTFVREDGTLYDKELFDCNYAIIGK